jgi:hypothetical protein
MEDEKMRRRRPLFCQEKITEKTQGKVGDLAKNEHLKGRKSSSEL